MSSALEQQKVVKNYLLEELSANCIIQIQGSDAHLVHCSPFGVIPKQNRPNKWRLIVDLSAPDGHSINDGIDKDLASLAVICFSG